LESTFSIIYGKQTGEQGRMKDTIPMKQFSLRDMTESDWSDIRRIYEEGIATGLATFETSAPDWDKWDASHRKSCRLVAVSLEGEILGWAAFSPVSSRCVYAGVVEISIYIAAYARGKGVGKALLLRMIDLSEQEGVWTVQAGIMADNTASIRLHESCGFRLVGRREKIGQLHGEWRDTILMERRSPKI
jgi:phosphinothricin acetyltransferase